MKSTSNVQSITRAKDLAGKKVIVGSGTNQERILLGWNEENKKAGREPALPVYLTDDASGNLYIQSGRADVFFGPQSVSAYKAALTGKTRVVGLGPKKAYVATTTKKVMGWCMRCRLRWTVRLSAGSIKRCWRAGGSGRSGDVFRH